MSSVKKTDTIAIGAELRGFSLRGATSAYRQHDVSARDIVAVVVCVAVLAAAIALNVL